MEIIVIVLLVAFVIWLVIRGRRRATEAHEATLARAWRASCWTIRIISSGGPLKNGDVL